jgi:hypothetical protein
MFKNITTIVRASEVPTHQVRISICHEHFSFCCRQLRIKIISKFIQIYIKEKDFLGPNILRITEAFF